MHNQAFTADSHFGNLLSVSNLFFRLDSPPLKENINVTEACPHQQSQGDQEIYVIDLN